MKNRDYQINNSNIMARNILCHVLIEYDRLKPHQDNLDVLKERKTREKSMLITKAIRRKAYII